MALAIGQSVSMTDVLSSALGSRLSIALLAIVVACLAGMVLGMRALRRLKLAQPASPPILRDEAGVATIEFALLTPILLFLGLMLTQSTLAMGANVFIHYAAFAAARAAVVQIPSDTGDDPRNTITTGPGSSKHDAIHIAASYALLPIGGEQDGGGEYATGPIAQGLRSFYSSYGATPPPWIDNLVVPRLNYVSTHTEVRLFHPVVVNETLIAFEPVTGSYSFDPKDPVTVEVVHGFYLSVPYASWAFSDATQNVSSTVSGGDSRRVMTISASATMTLEGLPDELPPEPPLPRLP